MDENLQSDVKLKTRLIISEDDFLQAREFIQYVLKKNLHEDENSENYRVVLKAFNTAIIVIYCRPFTSNNSSEINPNSSKKNLLKESLPEEYMQLLTDEEKILHKRIYSIRNGEQAHSDANNHSVGYYGMVSIKRDTTIPLPKFEFERLERILDKFISKIRLDKSDINKRSNHSK